MPHQVFLFVESDCESVAGSQGSVVCRAAVAMGAGGIFCDGTEAQEDELIGLK